MLAMKRKILIDNTFIENNSLRIRAGHINNKNSLAGSFEAKVSN